MQIPLSTFLMNKSFSVANVLCGKRFIVQKESLADLVRQIRSAKNMSFEDVRKKSGGDLAASYIHKIENDYVDPSVISVGKLQALSKGLGIPIEVLFNAAAGISNNSLNSEGEAAEELAVYIHALPLERRLDLLRFAKMFYEEQAGAGERDFIIAKKTPKYEMTDETKPAVKKRRAG